MIIKIKEIEAFLSTMYMEREEMIRGMLIAFIARQHVLLVGAPGTAKIGNGGRLIQVRDWNELLSMALDTVQHARRIVRAGVLKSS